MTNIKISDKAAIKLQKKLDKFINGLSSPEVVLLGTLYDRFWLELAFMEAVKYDEVKHLFERKQLEALQHYIIRGNSAEQVNSDFALLDEEKIDILVKKFKSYCAAIKEESIDKDVN